MEITKSHNHHVFWIKDCVLHESYQTIRGLRYRPVCEILLPDNYRLTDEEIQRINEMLNQSVL